jgi:heme-degrading monooxygenase HmoA
MFLVVFRNRKRADIDGAAYARDAEAMEALARAQPGFLSFKSYAADDGEVIAVSEWADEASARAWGCHAEHAETQARGRESYYAEYTLFACPEPRVRRFGGECLT